jgi:hypothetical protein
MRIGHTGRWGHDGSGASEAIVAAAAIKMGPEGQPVTARRWPAGLAWALWALPMLGLAGTAWLDHLLRQAGRPELATTVGALPPILSLVSATTVGAVVASRRPSHPVGWLLLALGVALGVNGVVSEYAPYGLLARPGSLPAAGYAAQAYPPTALIALTCLGFVLLLTPTGSLPSPRWRWWARLAAVAPVLSLLAAALTPLPAASRYQVLDNPFDSRALSGAALVAGQIALAVAVVALLVGAGSLVVRFRRAAGVERQQLRWVALAVALVVPVGVVVLVAVALVGPGTAILIGWAVGLFLALPPLAIGAAILRYRLYDLDRIISRTLAYGLLTVLLGGAYAGVVLGLGQLLGQGRSLVVAGATLALAAVFQPARRRVQGLVDRRFNRRRYDAAATIAAFSVRLRQQVDLDALRGELLAVVEQTMQPTRVSLWLRPR